MFRNVKKELITIPAQMSYLSQVRDFIELIGKKHKYSDKVINSFKLVIEEACTNIIRHGYRDIKGGEIAIKAIIRGQSLTIVIIDQGTSYDPRQATTPDLDKYIQIGKKGGLGIFMMRKLMDDVQYNITNRGNELRITKQREIITQSKIQTLWENLTMRTRYTIRASAVITLIAAITFAFLYSRVDQSNMEEVVETVRAQSLSLADNSSDILQNEKYLDLFLLARSLKNNNPELIKEIFIVDTMDVIHARSSLTRLGTYIYPQDISIIEDSINSIKIYQYQTSEGEFIYDFAAEIHSGIGSQGAIIGWAHIWVSSSFIEDKAGSTKFYIIILISFLLLISYALSYFLIDRIVTPFHSLADWVRQVGQGTVDDDEIDIDASDELGEIAQAFNAMTNKFREAQVGLIEQQRLQKELQVAQEIQQMLLPSDFPQVTGYELASFYEAAKEVGGDLFDFVEVDADTIGICVADVSGKGVPGSLIMTMIRTALRLEARGNKNPAEVLSKVNRFVTDDMRRGMFVTMFYIVLDSRNRVIHYASAGHNPMILYRGSTKQTYYLNPSGFPVGIQLPDISLFDKRIEQDTIRLREDDLLVLYTDGITEAMNPKRELYRDERFLDAIRENAHFDVTEFIESVKKDINNHTKGYPQNDDITFVAVKEKLMQGEVIYSIHKELFHLIEEGMAVKDACEKMQVSPYMYRKYKKVKDNVGLEGLKELLYHTDYIEKKHLSIEVKTKLYDVLKDNPQYGPKKISSELDTEKYSFTKLEPSRIYNELKNAKLNTKEKRENFVKRGGKKRIKLPGTPLLTLDGKVILDCDLAEKVTANKRSVESKEQKPTEFVPDKKTAELQLSTKKEEEVEKPKQEFVESAEVVDTQIQIQEKEKVEEKVDEVVEVDESTELEEPEDEVYGEVEESVDVTEGVELQPDESGETITFDDLPVITEKIITPEAEDTKFISLEEFERIDQTKKIALSEIEEEKKKHQEALKESENIKGDIDFSSIDIQEKSEEQELLEETVKSLDFKAENKTIEKSVTEELKEDKLNEEPESIPESTIEKSIPSFTVEKKEPEQGNIELFYKTINDDIKIINDIINEWKKKDQTNGDISKILLTLKIASKNPLLKKLGNVKQLFEQAIKGITLLENYGDTFEIRYKIQNVKEILKYIQKENILSNSSRILEQINELGIKHHQMRDKVMIRPSKNQSQMDAVRKKIAQKNLIKNVSILETISKTNRE